MRDFARAEHEEIPQMATERIQGYIIYLFNITFIVGLLCEALF